MLQIDKYGHLVVRGERQLSGHKFVSFYETFKLPQNINIEETSGIFEDGEIFCITLPKLSELELRRMRPVRDQYEKPYSTNRDIGQSMRTPESNDSNIRNNQSPKRPDEFIDPEVQKPIDSDAKSKMKMWSFVGLIVILLIVIVVPISIKLHK